MLVNVHFNVTQNKNYSSAPPNPEITILSPDYYLCLWSYVIKGENNTYSNEIYSNLFSFKTGKTMVHTEYLLNKLRGYSQDTPSATTLFNTSNHLTHGVAIVWESQITDTQTHTIIDAIFGRIITWSIMHNNGYTYVKITSPQSKEFQISSPSIDYLRHKNPNVISIYNTGKFLVSWISHDNNENINYNMIFIRIYYNSGIPYSEQIPIHKTDLYWKKYPQSIPLLYNLTLISWLTQSYNNQLIIYGMIFDDKGNNKLQTGQDADQGRYTDQGRYIFTTIADNNDHTIYNKTVPIITYLHNNPVDNNTYFMIAYNSINTNTKTEKTNTMYGVVYVYNYDTNVITQISEITPLFKQPYNYTKYIIESPQIENIHTQLYELENGLNTKVALCFTMKDLIFDKSDILCKIFQISLWNTGEEITANIEIITNAKMINAQSLTHHRHELPSISSQSILGAQYNYSDDPSFAVVWSNSRIEGYDVYTTVLQVNSFMSTTMPSFMPTAMPSFMPTTSIIESTSAYDNMTETKDSNIYHTQILTNLIIGLGIAISLCLLCLFAHRCYIYKCKVSYKSAATTEENAYFESFDSVHRARTQNVTSNENVEIQAIVEEVDDDI